MPTLCFSDDFTAKQRKTLTTTFRQNCRDLGLADFDATVQIRKQRLGADGPEGCVCHLADDCFVVVLNAAKTIRSWIFTIGHELVHVRQYRTGQLRDDKRTGGTFWKSIFVPEIFCNSRAYYSKLPWEIEAHSLQDDLFERAMEALP